MSILNNYNLTFQNRVFTYPNGQQENIKDVVQNSAKKFLEFFLDTMRDNVDDLIDNFNIIISEGSYNPDYDFGLYNILYIKYTSNSLKFYTKFGGDFIQEIPFTDVIQILQLWKTFNQTPPLHNQIL